MDALHPAALMHRSGYEPSFARALDVFITALRTGAQPEPNPASALDLLYVVEAARRSMARGGVPAEVDHAPPEPAAVA